MLFEELQRLVAGGETDQVEFKKTSGQRTEGAKTACAMLNGIGGFILFGVSDNGTILGQEVTAKTLTDITAELSRIEPPAFPEVEAIAIGGGKCVIVIRVSGKMGTYAYDNRAYLRYGPATRAMPREEYDKRVLEKFHAHQRWENELAPDWVTIRDLDEEAIQITLKNAVRLGRMVEPSSQDAYSVLRGLNLFKGDRLINAAIALYGKSEALAPLFPQFSIRLARFRGVNRTGGFMDNREYRGHAFNLLGRAEAFLMDHIPISGRIVPGKIIREDYPLYPPSAMREAVANAICHRDYTFAGGAIAIAIYDDHLEIINPGILNFDVTPEKLKKPHESKPWNPIIANAFYRAGIIERWGTGTLNILEYCKENGNPQPNWEIRTHSVITTFFPSTFFATGKRPEEMAPELRAESIKLTVLRLLSSQPLSRAEIARKLGYKTIPGGLHKILARLFADGEISYILPEKPNSRLQKYTLGKKTKG